MVSSFILHRLHTVSPYAVQVHPQTTMCFNKSHDLSKLPPIQGQYSLSILPEGSSLGNLLLECPLGPSHICWYSLNSSINDHLGQTLRYLLPAQVLQILMQTPVKPPYFPQLLYPLVHNAKLTCFAGTEY